MASKRLYVGNLSYTTTEDDLRSAFGKGGEVKDVFVVTDRETGRPRGFAFVEMGSAEEAQRAASEMDGATLNDRELKVNEAEERVERESKPRGESSGRGYDRGGGNRPAARGYGSDRDSSDRPERKPKEKPRRGARDGDRKPRDF